MRQLSTRDQNDKDINTIGHRTAFNNEQSPYHIVSYKRPQYDNVKQTNGLIYIKKMNEKQICNT